VIAFSVALGLVKSFNQSVNHRSFSISPRRATSGTALRGSLKLPDYRWVINVHPQFFDILQTFALEPLIRQTGLSG